MLNPIFFLTKTSSPRTHSPRTPAHSSARVLDLHDCPALPWYNARPRLSARCSALQQRA